MKFQVAVSVLVLMMACGQPNDEREFASGLGALDPNESYNSDDSIALEGVESRLLEAGIAAGALEIMGQPYSERTSESPSADSVSKGKPSPGKDKGKPDGKVPTPPSYPPHKDPGQGGGKEPLPPAKDPGQSDPGKTSPSDSKQPGTPGTKPKAPQLTAEVQAKLTACYAQWGKLPWNAETLIDIRELRIDSDLVRRTRLEVGGSKPELVLVSIRGEKNLPSLELTLNNQQALYCVDASAAQSMDKLQVSYGCGERPAVLGPIAGGNQRASMRQTCRTP